MWVYTQSEPGLLTVGFYDPAGKWHSDSDHATRDGAAARVAMLNGGSKSGGGRIKFDDTLETLTLEHVTKIETRHTGGGTMVDLLTLPLDRGVLGISEDSVCLYRNVQEFDSEDDPDPPTLTYYDAPAAPEAASERRQEPRDRRRIKRDDRYHPDRRRS